MTATLPMDDRAAVLDRTGPRPLRAPRGTTLSCKGWQQEAALRMLLNNLDPEVAERPDDLVVYGGTGRAARSWEALDMHLVYDVAHNIAKFEEHRIDGQTKTLCVHRKGATRAFPPNHPEIPQAYRAIGQPVLIPGSMGTASWILVGQPGSMEQTFGTTCHGAGRQMSRTAAVKEAHGRRIDEELQQLGIIARARSRRELPEEQPKAYKDVDAVVDVVHRAGLSKKVARCRPIGVIKG